MTYSNYQLVLKQTSGLCTPLQADTLWGHFTGYLAQTKPELLADFIATYQGTQPALIFSDGLPALCNEKMEVVKPFVPKPLFPFVNDIADKYKADKGKGDVESKTKIIKKTEWISVDDYLILANNSDFSELEMCVGAVDNEINEIEVVSEIIIRNQVSRTGEEDTTPFPLEERWLKSSNAEKLIPVWTVFVKIRTDWIELLGNGRDSSLQSFLKLGYGKKKNIGKGQFEITFKVVADSLFPTVQEPNAFMSLSSFVPAENDPTDGYWQTFTKYGKLGEAAPLLNGHISDNPFKSPIVMLKPGAVFKIDHVGNGRDGSLQDYYGNCNLNANGRIRKEPSYIHPALAFVMPYRIK